MTNRPDAKPPRGNKNRETILIKPMLSPHRPLIFRLRENRIDRNA